MIIKPLKMNSTTFDTNGLITSINDYFKLCNNICNSSVHLTRHKDLQKSISVLSEIMSKYQNSCFSYIDINGIYTLIDVKHKIVAMYNQAPTRICNNQIDMLETLKSLIYDSCINHDFSKGYNLFP